MTKRKKIVIISERDKDIFDEFGIIIAGGLGALGIDRILSDKVIIGLIMLGISFLIILVISKCIRGKLDTK